MLYNIYISQCKRKNIRKTKEHSNTRDTFDDVFCLIFITTILVAVFEKKLTTQCAYEVISTCPDWTMNSSLCWADGGPGLTVTAGWRRRRTEEGEVNSNTDREGLLAEKAQRFIYRAMASQPLDTNIQSARTEGGGPRPMVLRKRGLSE